MHQVNLEKLHPSARISLAFLQKIVGGLPNAPLLITIFRLVHALEM